MREFQLIKGSSMSCKTKARAKKILEILEKEFSLEYKEFTALIAKKSGDSFKILVATILSQNTNDRNSKAALKRLESKFELRPEVLANACFDEIVEAIRPAGLQFQKAKAIKEVSAIIANRFDGKLDKILKKPLDDARKELVSLPGVGPKTADVLLLFSLGLPTIPVDTHVMRVTRRIGLAPKAGGYETVRKALMEVLNPEDYLRAHLLLIKLGRTFCKSRRPQCFGCPIRKLCDSGKREALAG